MKTVWLVIGSLMLVLNTDAQVIKQRLENAMQKLLNDAQLKHALASLHVADAKTGKEVYDYNGDIGMAPASSQKIFTSTAAFELLGKDYRFKTELGYDGKIKDTVLQGNLYLAGYGDPSFGSWRYPSNTPGEIEKRLGGALLRSGIKNITGDIVLDDTRFNYQPLPGGWTWEDMGNYYGAGSWALNWNENQYDLKIKPGKKEGDDATILSSRPQLETAVLNNLLKTGPKGSGDNTNIYLPPYSITGFAEGTVPAGEPSFIVSGSMPNPAYQLGKMVEEVVTKNGISYAGTINNITGANYARPFKHENNILETLYSPALDSIVFWFLQKSINLYGETLVKTFALEKTGRGSTEKGLEILRSFWEQKGIEKSALKMIDGSGLSPQNRVTTQALVQALQFAKTRPWFNSFYTALPVFNGTKMKSGTIGGCKAFAGYQTAANGQQYTFAIIINNYDGSTDAVIQKMFRVLNELK